MEIRVVDEKGNPIDSPYILYLSGWTEEQYLKEAPRNQKCEFVQGEIILMGPIGKEHSDVLTFLGFLLRGFCKAKKLGVIFSGGFTIRLFPEVHREPDICFYPQEMLPLSSEIPCSQIPPFVAEVSWTTRNIDLFEKAEEYAQAGVQEYWVVDLDEKELVVHLGQGKYQKRNFRQGKVESQVIPGFWVQAEWLLSDPLPNDWDCLQKILGL